MAERHFRKLLIDTWSNLRETEWALGAEDLGQAAATGKNWSVAKEVLRGGRQEGVDTVTLDNGRLRLEILPTRGMGIQAAWFEGLRLGWDSPVGEVVHPAYVRAEEDGGLGWLRGFTEWFVRCGMTHNGAPCDDDGVARPLHGRVANLPASATAFTAGLEKPYLLGVHGVVQESRLFHEQLLLETAIETEPGANWVRIADTVTSGRAVPSEMQMLYHINYGPPFLEEGSRLLAPCDRVVPRDAVAAPESDRHDRYGPPTAGKPESVFFYRPRADRKGRTLHALRNAAGDLAVSQSYRLRDLPCLTVWKNEAALEDGYVTGLEPGTNYPNPVAFERAKKRTVTLRPGRRWSAELTLAVHVGKKEVQSLEKRIRAIQGRKRPDVADAPDPALCAGCAPRQCRKH